MSSSSLREARLYSIVILVLRYVGLSYVWDHQQRLATVADARQAMARLIVASRAIDRLAAQQPGSQENGDARVQNLMASTDVRGLAALGEVDESVRSDVKEEGRWVDVRVRLRGGGQWGVAKLRTPEGAMGLKQSYDENLAALLDAAAQVGIFESQDADVAELYVKIEQLTLGTEVVVPGVGLGFQGMQVVWVCVVATFSFLVILRDCVQHVLTDDEIAVSERWLVLDGDKGLEYALSQLWLAALIIGPIALSSGLVLGITAQIAADGATSSLGPDILTTAAILVLLTGNGWVSLNTASRILELRDRRLALASQ
jgi:hypothetical protein